MVRSQIMFPSFCLYLPITHLLYNWESKYFWKLIEKWYTWSYLQSRNGDEERKYIDTKWGRGVGGIEKLGQHIYTIDTMYKINK